MVFAISPKSMIQQHRTRINTDKNVSTNGF